MNNTGWLKHLNVAKVALVALFMMVVSATAQAQSKNDGMWNLSNGNGPAVTNGNGSKKRATKKRATKKKAAGKKKPAKKKKPNAVPEPESLALMGIGVAALGLAARRRRKSK